MTNYDERLDKILDRVLSQETSREGGYAEYYADDIEYRESLPYGNPLANRGELKQAILDWHNKQIEQSEEVLTTVSLEDAIKALGHSFRDLSYHSDGRWIARSGANTGRFITSAREPKLAVFKLARKIQAEKRQREAERNKLKEQTMTNYNGRLDEILDDLVEGCEDGRNALGYRYDLGSKAKQAITSLIKELVAEAKPPYYSVEEPGHNARHDGIEQYETNLKELLKTLEEV